MRYTLRKREILRGNAFQEVFEHGRNIDGKVLRCVFLVKKKSSKHTLQRIFAGFAVRGRVVRKAVDRNRVRRLMREAYRLNKNVLTSREGCDHEVRLVFLFSPSEKEFVIPTYKEVEQDVKMFLNKIDSMVKS